MAERVPTDREIDILKVLWNFGEGAVRDVHQALAGRSGVHFNTVQTQLRIMDRKGLVTHRRDGRTLIYRPTFSREKISAQFLHKVFDGALNELVLSMLCAEPVEANELAELERIIADAKRRKKSRSRNKGK